MALLRRGVLRRERSLAARLAALWLALIVYASLFPFVGWRVPPGVPLVDLLRLPWTRWIPGFDPLANLLGYVPMGLLLVLAGSRQRQPGWTVVLQAVLAASMLSYGMEVLQQFVPRRVPSAQDWMLNSAGGMLGVVLGVAVQALGWRRRWRGMHERWLEGGGNGAAVLMLLWPLGLLFPTPLPFGQGQIGDRLRELGLGALEGVAWAEPLASWLSNTEVFEPASAATEFSVAVLGLLAPCLLAYAASNPSWRRIWLGLGAPLVAAATTTLATALNFGPQHALAWITPGVTSAMAVAMTASLLLVWIGPRLAGALALVVITGLVVLVHTAPTDPYFADSLQAWEQGKFIHFHGLAKWVGWLWPYAAMTWLLGRLRRVD